MLKRFAMGWMALVCLAAWGPWAQAGSHGGTDRNDLSEKGPVILLVTFGTSVPRAQAAFDNIGKRVRAAFPDAPVRWAYTSSIIREKLAKAGQYLDAPEIALAKLMDESYKRVAVQSLHMIPGAEFHDLQVNAGAFRGMVDGFDRLLIGHPALSTAADLDKVVDAVFRIVPPERKADEAVVLMGHGTHHPANVYYEAMMYRLQQRDPLVFMGTVEGTPTLADVKTMLLERGVQKAYLMPFMSVAGDHALNDMAGDDPDSWKSVLTEAGIECVPVTKGLAEFDPFADIWVDHLRAVMARMQ